MKDDHYKVLDVSRDASVEEIQHAYRTLALRYHPDRNSAPDAAARMTAINEAWGVLGDPHRRREYDALLQRPPLHPEFAASILLAARDVVLRSLDEAAELVRVGHLFQQLSAAGDAELVEIGPRGADRIEGVGFLPDLTEGDSHWSRTEFIPFSRSAVTTKIDAQGTD